MDADGDDVLMQGAVSSALYSSLELNSKEQTLSSEDLAWVDSCLVPDSNVPEGSWDMLRDALLDVLSSHPVAHLEFSDSGISQMASADEEVGGRAGKDLEEKNDKTSDLVNELRFDDALLPTYSEGVKESGTVDEVDDLGFVLNENETEPSVAEIFKVWELESPSEEGDLITQLNKALKSRPSYLNSAESIYETLPLSDDDAALAKWNDIKDESIDNLVDGIADLSLKQFNA